MNFLIRQRPVRTLLSTLVLALLAPQSYASEQARPLSPDEINTGVRLVGEDLQLSRNGRWFAFSTSKGDALVDLTSGNRINIRGGWSALSGSWSPLDSTLALGVHREGRMAFALWSVGAGPVEKETRQLLQVPRDLYPRVPPLWSPDGKTLFFFIHQDLPWPKSDPADDNPPTGSHNVRLRMTAPYRVASHQSRKLRFEKEYPEAYAERTRSLILALDVTSGRFGVLARGNDIRAIYLSPDGRRIAAVQEKLNKPMPYDVYLFDTVSVASLPAVDLETMEDRKAGWSDPAGKRASPVMMDLPSYNLLWSPDATKLAYVLTRRRPYGDVFVYDVASKISRNLTQDLPLGISPKSLGYSEDHVGIQKSHGFYPLWMPDSRELVATAGCETWTIPADPHKTPRLLSGNLPQESLFILRSVYPTVAAVDSQGRITVVARQRLPRYSSIWKLNPRTGESARRADTGLLIMSDLFTDAEEKQIFYFGQNERSVRNIQRLVLDGASAPEFFTRYNLELAERIHPDTRVLEYKTPEGRTGFGLLYLPIGASAANKVPMLVDGGNPGYPVSLLDQRAADGLRFYKDALHTWLQAGVAVLYPDIPMSEGGVYAQPMKQVVDGVITATDAAVATGVVDAARMGIMSSSLDEYGGFMVQAVITQTERFKAAASINGVSDWFASYLGTNYSAPNHEIGQGRFEKPLWEVPRRYMENSPIAYWDRVRTPLLLIEMTGNAARSDESFRGLERLDRTVIYANYTHGVAGDAPELKLRVHGWFREHLLGDPPTTQTADQGSFMFDGSAN